MVKLGGDRDLAQEPLGAERVGEFRVEDLDGDGAVVPQVVCEVDSGHAAVPELTLDAVAAGKARRELVLRGQSGGSLRLAART